MKNCQELDIATYYSEECDGTIISATAIVRQHNDKDSGWMQFANMDSNDGKIKLLGKHDQPNFTCPVVYNNDLWFHKHWKGINVML